MFGISKKQLENIIILDKKLKPNKFPKLVKSISGEENVTKLYQKQVQCKKVSG